jgi:Zn-finger nucleic acid-binding protein
MNCPRCTRDLVEVDRDGITIDRCDGCRGIWLDRGELEKLIARSAGEPRRSERDDDDDDDDRHRDRHGKQRRSWWEIFD